MNFTVVWKETAENALAEIWLTAVDRRVVAEAATEIDQKLGREPDSVGESRDKGRRILIARPLVAIYRVSAADRTVSVLDLWKCKRL